MPNALVFRPCPAVADAALTDFIASLYRGNLRRYARMKLRRDPLYNVVAEELLACAAPVLDIGCGIGLLGLMLRARGFRGRYVGIDCDRKKVLEARRIAAAHEPTLNFSHADAGSLPPFSGAVALLDVLHYLARDAPQALLAEAVTRVAVGAPLIIRTVLRAPTWRYVATVCEELVLHGVGWMQMPARHFPSQAEIEEWLGEHGLKTDVRPLWGATPFASFLITARRRI